MSTLPKPEAFLMFDLDMNALPEPYASAMNQHLELDPQIFMLPWPVEAFPQVGAKIRMHDATTPFERLRVENHELVLDLEGRLRMEANATAVEDGSYVPQEETLKAAARYGCLLFPSRTSVKGILEKAGLLLE